jgi:single-strand DNA-binding protein
MANGLNQCNFLGNIGVDPELRFTTSGDAVLKFRMACSEYRKQRDGSAGEHTEWVPVVVWGNRAEALSKFLEKGHRVFVTGKFQTRSWEDRGGGKRYMTEINAREVIVAGGGPRRGSGGGSQRQQEPERRAQRQRNQDPPPNSDSYPNEDYGPSGEDDDIPF